MTIKVNIEGFGTVSLDKGFTSLSVEEQEATINEIVGSRQSGTTSESLQTPSTVQPKAPSPEKITAGGPEYQTVVVQGLPDPGRPPQHWMNDEQLQQTAQMMADPKFSYEDIDAFVRKTALEMGQPELGLGGSPEQLAVYRESLAAGAEPQLPGVVSWLDQLPEAQSTVTASNPLLRAYQQAVHEGFPGFLSRMYHDWMDTGMEGIQQMFPNATPEQLEQLNDQFQAWVARGVREANQLRNEDLGIGWQLVGGMLGSPSPLDLVGFEGRLASGLAKSAGANVADDILWQGVDIAQGIQDEYSPEQTALAAAIGAGLHAGVSGVGATARALSTPSSPPPAPQALSSYLEIQANPPRKGEIKARTKALREGKEAAILGATEHIANVTRNWRNAPNIEVVASVKELSDPVLRRQLLAEGADKYARGVFASDGSVKIFLDKIDDVDDLNAVLFHEALGHHGLSQKFGDALDNVLNSFYEDGADTRFRAEVDKWLEDNPDAYLNAPNRHLRAAEEVLAEMSESGRIPRRIYDRIADLIKNVARSMGLDLKVSDREIRSILAQAHSATISGAPGRSAAANGFNKFATVWHGTPSPTPFERFDHSYIGKGEGAQVFGYGTYLTENRNIADTYYRQRLVARRGNWEMTIDTPDGPDSIYLNTKNVKKTLANEYVEEFISTGKSILDDFSEWSQATKAIHGYIDSLAAGDKLPPSPYNLAKLGTIRSANWLREHPDFYGPGTVWDELSKFLEKKNLKAPNRGQLLEVEIPDDATWLLWDKPLSEQPAKVRQIVSRDKELLGQWVVDRNLTGAEIYRLLAGNLNSQKRASDYLASKGITGNKYLTGMDRAAGEGQYNYVVFDDNTPKIINRYSRRQPPTSAGFKRPVMDERFKTEDRKLRRKVAAENIDNDAWAAIHRGIEPSDIGLPDPRVRTNAYARRKKERIALSPEELTADDLFESQNALDILNGLTEDYRPTFMSLEDLEREAEMRGVPLSRILRNKQISPGDITRRLYMFDIAMDKLNERITKLYHKIQSGQGTYRDRVAYAEALIKGKELSARIFEEQGEVGRALRAIQELSYTRNRVEGLKDTLDGVTVRGLKEILRDPDAFLRFSRDIQQQLDESVTKRAASKVSSFAANALNFPRAVMSSMDTSAPFRQGLVLVGRPEFWKNIPNMFKYLVSDRAYQGAMDSIRADDFMYREMIKSGLSFTDTSGKLSNREEAFQTEWAERVPGVKASNRAYAGYLNKLRADVFTSLYRDAKALGLDVSNTKLTRDIAKFINTATGRGQLGGVLSSGRPLMNAVFFSPGLMASRIQTLNPQYYMSLDPFVRKQALTSLASAAGFVSTLLGLAALGGADVEMDPRSSDFGKIKIGNTRYDIAGGFSQYLTLYSRLSAYLYNQTQPLEDRIGEYKTATGKLRQYGTDFGERSAYDAIHDFFRNKLSPVPSLGVEIFEGQNVVGDPVEIIDMEQFGVPVPGRSILERVSPMFLQDYLEIAEEHGLLKGAVRAAPALIGVGIQNYTPSSIDPERESEPPDSFKMQELEDGENDLVVVRDGEVILKGEAKEEWRRIENFYLREWMAEELASPDWKNLSIEEKEKVIKAVRTDARAQARKDMLPLLGLSAFTEGSTEPPVQPIVPGNLPTSIREVVRNEDGTVSTVRTISIGTEAGEVLIPTVIDGRVVTDDEAIAHYERTGENFGTFASAAEAKEYAEWLSNSHSQAMQIMRRNR